jgi:hypothetical protein
MSNREAGKGSKPRPLSIPTKEFDNNWDRIFKKQQETPPSEEDNNKHVSENH